jgi:heat shock protein HtpX
MAMWFGDGQRAGLRGPAGWADCLTIFLLPIAAGLIRTAISRTSQFSADGASACVLGTEEPMIKALERLDLVGKQIPLEVSPNPRRDSAIPRTV